jgi:hypothetical protein
MRLRSEAGKMEPEIIVYFILSEHKKMFVFSNEQWVWGVSTDEGYCRYGSSSGRGKGGSVICLAV